MVADGGAENGLSHEAASSKVKGRNELEKQNEEKILAFKGSHILLSILFLWFLAVQLLGLVLFCKGFLLTRLVLDSKSACATLPNGESSLAKDGCWHPKTFDKAVIIVIDALRYDFTVPSSAAPVDRQPGHYLDNLPLLYDYAAGQPQNAFLLPFIADPPTSTLQRLKGLATGTLPVFIDVGSNFAGTAIEEDNIVSQLKAAGKRMVHLGDDTWQALFPGYFVPDLTHAYDSFNAWDLHTVDNGVIEHIFPLLDSVNQTKWDVIFAHFLGVDHAGHRYGPDHVAMTEKLRQMNQVLQEIVTKIDDQTLLVVMGDHGMDVKGDHGGESDNEVEAALWLYSKQPRFGRPDPSQKLPPATAKERPVAQIDLVSTLSLLLGLPIPFNNLGTPIPEAFIGSDEEPWKNLATAELLAFEQIQNYQNEYSRSRDLGPNEPQQELLHQVVLAAQNKNWRAVHEAYLQWHHETIRMYRELWANFNIPDMLHGIEILGVGLIVLFIISRLWTVDLANSMPGLLQAIGIGTAGGTLLGPFLPVVLPGVFTATTGTLYGTGLGGLVGASASILINYRKYLLPLGWPSFWSSLSLVFCLTQSAGFAANSFTIHEDTILLFFLSTFGTIALMSSLRQQNSKDRTLGAYHSITFVFLTRLASYSRLCREEQVSGCQTTFYASSTSSTAAPWHLFIPFLIALLLPEFIKAFYQGTASYAGSAGFWIGFSFRLGLALVALYWTVDAADNGDWLNTRLSPSTLETIKLTLARLTLAVAVPVGIGTFGWAKPCIDVSMGKTSQKNPEDTARATAAAPAATTQITILGYANVFGTRFFLLLPLFVILSSLLLPPMGQFSMAICAWQILCLMEILDTNGLTITQISNSSIGPVVLAMLGSYHFFKTGHQAVLSSIQWNSAFVPFQEIHYPWSPLLVILNTFGGQILCAAAVPLSVLWKRQVSKHGLRGLWTNVANACLTHVLYYATVQLATTVWAGHLRRHLMLYRVFMPRFLMASVVLLIVDVVLVLVALPSVRVTGLSVGEIFGY
ncbi:hypothetical protein DV738_g1028, partial [Chaetothyriales sp. CBS 135597]